MSRQAVARLVSCLLRTSTVRLSRSVAQLRSKKKAALPAFEWIRNGNSRGDHPRGNGLESDVSLVFSTGCLRRGGSGAGTVGNAGACGGRERFPSAAERRGREAGCGFPQCGSRRGRGCRPAVVSIL